MVFERIKSLYTAHFIKKTFGKRLPKRVLAEKFGQRKIILVGNPGLGVVFGCGFWLLQAGFLAHISDTQWAFPRCFVLFERIRFCSEHSKRQVYRKNFWATACAVLHTRLLWTPLLITVHWIELLQMNLGHQPRSLRGITGAGGNILHRVRERRWNWCVRGW